MIIDELKPSFFIMLNKLHNQWIKNARSDIDMLKTETGKDQYFPFSGRARPGKVSRRRALSPGRGMCYNNKATVTENAESAKEGKPVLLFDTHADTLHSLAAHPDRATDVTLPRLRQGGVSAQTLALYVGGSPKMTDIARTFDAMLEKEKALQAAGWTKLADYRDAREGESAYILSVEGCDLLDGRLDGLARWRGMGVRMAAITWNYENSLGTPAKLDQSAPLKPFGRAAALEMRRLGIAPDTSHLSDRGFYDLLDLGVVPLASHSCCRALCGHARNLTDGMLRDLFSAGGYVGVNFYPYFLSDDGKADLDTVCDHVVHIFELGGGEHVGFGSDFDGIETKPRGLEGPQDFPRLMDRLRARGFSQEEIAGLAGKNLISYYDRIDPRNS